MSLSFWSIIDPEQQTNYVLNPVAGTTGNFAALAGATVTRDTTYAYLGLYCYKIVPGGTNRGMTLTLSALANAIHGVQVYVRGNAAATIQMALDGATWSNTVSVIGGKTGGWVRYANQIPAAQANGSTTLSIRNTANETFYVGIADVQPTSGYYTTPICGEMSGLYRWNGLRHGSTSTRSAQERGGGRERDLKNDYGIVVRAGEGTNNTSGIGMPPQQINRQPLALQPGEVLQSVKTLPREIVLDFLVNTDAGSTWKTLHQNRQRLINLVKTSRVRGAQPFVIRYSGCGALDGSNAPTLTDPLYARFTYSSGLEFYNVVGMSDAPQVRLYAADPWWYEDNREVAALDFTDTITTPAGTIAKIDGEWQALGSGMNGDVYAIVTDNVRGRIYYGGGFTTGNGVTLNGFGYWNTTTGTFVAVGGATKGVSGGIVSGLAIAPNGDVWGVGSFTAAGGSTTKGLFRYNVATDTFTVFNLSTASGSQWFTVTIDSNYVVYVFGNYTDWNGIAAADYCAKYTNSTATWAAMGTSPFGADDFPAGSYGAVTDPSNNVYVGSSSVGGTAKLRKFDGTTWTTLAETDALADVYTLYRKPDGTIIAGGQGISTFGGATVVNVGLWNGSTIVALGTGLSGGVLYNIARLSSGLIIFLGSFTGAGGFTLTEGFVFWNGYTYVLPDLDLPGSATVFAAAIYQDDIYLGTSNTGGNATSSGTTSVTPTSTAPTFPSIIITGPTTAATSCTLKLIENRSTNEVLNFNVTIQAGETVVIDLATGKKTTVSDWRGLIQSQPLQGSDLASFGLLPSQANTILAYISGTVTGVVANMAWTPVHESVDGGA